MVDDYCLGCQNSTLGYCPLHPPINNPVVATINNPVFVPSVSFYPALNQGWQCPGCQRCYAPSVTQCWSCGEWSFSTTGTTKIEIAAPVKLEDASDSTATPPYESFNEILAKVRAIAEEILKIKR